jgi:hypothetical protein
MVFFSLSLNILFCFPFFFPFFIQKYRQESRKKQKKRKKIFHRTFFSHYYTDRKHHCTDGSQNYSDGSQNYSDESHHNSDGKHQYSDVFHQYSNIFTPESENPKHKTCNLLNYNKMKKLLEITISSVNIIFDRTGMILTCIWNTIVSPFTGSYASSIILSVTGYSDITEAMLSN